jgi:hypothetical protein
LFLPIVFFDLIAPVKIRVRNNFLEAHDKNVSTRSRLWEQPLL